MNYLFSYPKDFELALLRDNIFCSLRKLPSTDEIREGLLFLKPIFVSQECDSHWSEMLMLASERDGLPLLLLILGRGGKINKSLSLDHIGEEHNNLQTKYSVSMNWNRSQKGVKSMKPHKLTSAEKKVSNIRPQLHQTS